MEFSRKLETELTELFENAGFETSWDYDNMYKWIEVIDNGTLILQIDSEVTVEQFIDLLVDDYNARQKGIFINPKFFIAMQEPVTCDEEMLNFSNKFDMFKERIS